MSNKSKRITPPVNKTNIVQIDDIRRMLLDSAPADYTLVDDDFYFSDEEITDAMRRATEAFNDLPPISIKMSTTQLGNRHKALFKTGVCWQAYLTKFLLYTRKVIQYKAGGTSVDAYQQHAQFAKAISDGFKQDFLSQAPLIKRSINMSRCWGSIG